MSDSISHPRHPAHPRSASAAAARNRHRTASGRAATGFTLVEILTVISIIVVLIGLLFVAIKYARNSAARSATAAQMDTLRGMLAELDSANHFSQSPPAWLWWDANTATPVYVDSQNAGPFTNSMGTFTPDFWKYPWSLVNSAAASPHWDALDSPGDVGTDGGPQQASQRNASCAILNTQLAMQLLAAVPANRAALDKLPANSKALPQWDAGPVLLAMPGSGGYVGLLKEDNTDGKMSANSTYLQGMHVTYQGKFYSCVVTPTSSSTAPSPLGTTPWLDESAAPRGAPILLDGWGNPIIYVPATGLHVKKLNGQGAYLPTDPPGATAAGGSQQYIIISPEGQVTGNGTTNPIVVRPGRPFFASAGPDGDFTKGDDNLYSFEN